MSICILKWVYASHAVFVLEWTRIGICIKYSIIFDSNHQPVATHTFLYSITMRVSLEDNEALSTTFSRKRPIQGVYERPSSKRARKNLTERQVVQVNAISLCIGWHNTHCRLDRRIGAEATKVQCSTTGLLVLCFSSANFSLTTSCSFLNVIARLVFHVEQSPVLIWIAPLYPY